MAFGMFGKKKGMTQKFLENGDLIPVTVIDCSPCVVVQKKTKECDGYNALQLGFGEEKKSQNVNRAAKGHFQKAQTALYKHLGEFRLEDTENVSVGDQLGVQLFNVGDCISVRSRTIGRGFQGVIKRHGFGRGPMSHGSTHHRAPGSIGMCQDPGRVIKNKKLPGHMGSVFKTMKNLQVVDIDPENNLLFIRGSVPGSKNCILKLVHVTAKLGERFKKGEEKVDAPEKEEKREEVKEVKDAK